MEEVPVYLFTGFMDSGKTSMILETLIDNGFARELERVLIIACEDGDVEYTDEKLKAAHATLKTFENEEDLTREALQSLEDEIKPDAVFIEYNGTWETGKLFDEDGELFPKGWMILQHLCTVDATNFELYMQNMRVMMQENIFHAEVVIFNRCTDSTNKTKFRSLIKAINRPAQLVYIRTDGSVDDRPEELPYDITKSELDITDADYCVWFEDCMEYPKKYDGKTVKFRALVYNPTTEGKLKPGTFVPGRFAMTCCVEDIQFLGMKAKYADSKNIEHKSWIDITAKVKNEFAKEYHGKGPVLYPVSIEKAEKPEDELVYFN
ncbi:MAG: GTPase [Lachnospiraceae bacterium]|nr:GTPase [Lachnospiraceae bacterium]